MTDFVDNLAFLVGIDCYDESFSPLRTPGKDVAALGEFLEGVCGYRVAVLSGQVTRRRLFREWLRAAKIVGANTRMLVYFAGHGVALESETGPAGTIALSDSVSGRADTLLSMNAVAGSLRDLPCRHLLLILDCCFAGSFHWTLGSTRGARTLPPRLFREHLARFARDPARQVITSAAYDQQAMDLQARRGDDVPREHSPFAAALLRGLVGEADIMPPGGDGVITVSELALYLRDKVEGREVRGGIRQTPQLWPMPGHDKGEFFFLVPGDGHPPLPSARDALGALDNPWRGLEVYETEHGADFFGRETAVRSLWEQVRTRSALPYWLSIFSRKPRKVVLSAVLPGMTS